MELFEDALERVRLRYLFVVAGYAGMPEHVHLLVNEPRRALLSVAVQALKLSVSVRSRERPFWQAHYYDRNVNRGHPPPASLDLRAILALVQFTAGACSRPWRGASMPKLFWGFSPGSRAASRRVHPGLFSRRPSGAGDGGAAAAVPISPKPGDPSAPLRAGRGAPEVQVTWKVPGACFINGPWGLR